MIKILNKLFLNSFWSIINTFVNIIVMIAVIIILSKTYQGFWLNILIIIFIIWAFRPIILELIKLCEKEQRQKKER